MGSERVYHAGFLRTPFEVSGSPTEMGRARGEQLRTRLRERVDRVLRISLSTQAWDTVDQASAAAEQALGDHHPDLLAEMRGIAAGADIPYREFRLAALGRMWPQNLAECSAFAVRREGGTVVGKNDDLYALDWELADVVVIKARPNKGYPYIAPSALPELPGRLDGMSEHVVVAGASVALMIAPTPTSPRLPVYFDVAEAIQEARNVAEALEALRKRPPSPIGRSLVLGDRSRVAHVELAASTLDMSVEAGAGIATNNFRMEEMVRHGERPDQSSVRRHDALHESLSGGAYRRTGHSGRPRIRTHKRLGVSSRRGLEDKLLRRL
jgi:hypothetical protein